MKHLNKQKGFTIVELVIVIAVIAVLSAVLIPTFSNIVANAKKTADEADAKSIYEQYKVQIIMDENGIEDINGNNQEEVLVVLRYGQADAKYFLFVNGQMGESSIDADCDVVIDENGKMNLSRLIKIHNVDDLNGKKIVLGVEVDNKIYVAMPYQRDGAFQTMEIESLIITEEQFSEMAQLLFEKHSNIDSSIYWTIKQGDEYVCSGNINETNIKTLKTLNENSVEKWFVEMNNLGELIISFTESGDSRRGLSFQVEGLCIKNYSLSNITQTGKYYYISAYFLSD